MDPVAFRLGPLTIYWYGVLIATGVMAGFFVARHLGRKFNLPRDIFEEFLLFVLPAALVGARLWYVLFKLDYYLADPVRILAIRQGGLAIHGAVLASLLVAIIFCRYRKIDFFRFADVAAPALILGQAIGRWGNFFNQEAYGRATDLPWAMYIAGEYRHPTFLYESIWNLAVFALMWKYIGSKPHPGRVFALYLAGYSLGRLWIEALRTDSLMLGPFRVAQLVSLAMIAAGAALFIYSKLRRKEDTGESSLHQD